MTQDSHQLVNSETKFPSSDIAILARAEILSKKKLKQTLRSESHKYIEQFTYRGMDGDEVRIGNDDWKLKLNKDCTKDSDAFFDCILHVAIKACELHVSFISNKVESLRASHRK